MLIRLFVVASLMLSVPSWPLLAQDANEETRERQAEAVVERPTTRQILYALQDVNLPLKGIRVRNTVSIEIGATALLQLPAGTLVDVRLAAAQEGWTVRDLGLVAGNAEDFYGWSESWQSRVAAAEDFLAAVDSAGVPTRTAEELAPLTWFEDPEKASRLWGMNPMTYRMMQTLQMIPTLQGPTGAGSPTDPVPRRDRDR